MSCKLIGRSSFDKRIGSEIAGQPVNNTQLVAIKSLCYFVNFTINILETTRPVQHLNSATQSDKFCNSFGMKYTAPGYPSLKYATDANAAKVLIMMTLSNTIVSLKLAMMAIAAKYWLQML